MISFEREFTKEGQHPFDTVKWKKYDALITASDGKVIFEQKSVEFPEDWSQNSVNIVAQKYFWGDQEKDERESSLKQIINRVVNTIGKWAVEQEYFEASTDRSIFIDELTYMLVHRLACFNSPVWFNLGIPENKAQVAACFLLKTGDTLEEIMKTATDMMHVFRGGSGEGCALSGIRSSREKLTGGGKPSGPLSFLKIWDTVAGVIKSGGKCLAPDQPVMTERGPIPVKELADLGQEFYVISWDPKLRRNCVKKAKAFSSDTKSIVEVITDKATFKLSHDHPVCLRTGEWVMASQLKPGRRLMPCGIKRQKGDYYRIPLHNGDKDRELLHRLVALDILGQSIANKVVHHIDENPLNNHPDNLSVITQSEHAKLHTELKVSEGTHVFQTHTFPKNGADNPMHSSADFWRDEEKVEAYKQKQSANISSERAKAQQALSTKKRMMNRVWKLINAGHDVCDFKSYMKALRRCKIGIGASKNRQLERIEKYFGSYQGLMTAVDNDNHKVLSIKHLGKSDVYDVEVFCDSPDDMSEDDGHNFVITDIAGQSLCGIRVHNSRRAAQFHSLTMEHPDILEFIKAKPREEAKQYLIRAAAQAVKDGALPVSQRVKDYVQSVKDWDSMDGEAASSAYYQNMNLSCWISDDFMKAEDKNAKWQTKSVTTGEVVEEYNARDLFKELAKSAWECACPGVVFDGEVQNWHTVANDGPITTCNPCSEFYHQDETSCNLAHLNLVEIWRRALRSPDRFEFGRLLTHCTQVLFLAQDIFINKADYPTPEIAEATKQYRPIGTGFANLGALLFLCQMPYDSEEGRTLTAAIMSVICGAAYQMSGKIADAREPFPAFARNESPMRKVIGKHQLAAYQLVGKTDLMVGDLYETHYEPTDLHTAEEIAQLALQGKDLWDSLDEYLGFANGQVTVLAPTGTTGIYLGCDTTGIEPLTGHVIYKNLAGGGVLKLTSPLVEEVLTYLKYEDKVEEICRNIQDGKKLTECGLKPEHLPIFDTAFGDEERSIHYMGHLKMLAAVQPFVSGSISKTVNVPASTTPEDIEDIYRWAWRNKLKCVAVYRDGSKSTQALVTSDPSKKAKEKAPAVVPSTISRRRPPDECPGPSRKRFSIGGEKGYIHTSYFEEDKALAEVFIRMYSQGSTVAGLLDAISKLLSWCAQHGILNDNLLSKLKGASFEPKGITKDRNIRFASSVVDYLARYLEINYPDGKWVGTNYPIPEEELEAFEERPTKATAKSSGEVCRSCGGIMKQNGTCFLCLNCGATTGCS